MTGALEPSREQMLDMGRRAVEFVAGFTLGLGAAPAVNLEGPPPRGRGEGDVDGQRAGRALREELSGPPGEAPGDFSALLERFGAAAAHAVETAGPGYLAYVPGGGLFASALAEFLSRATNRYTGLSALAPDLVAMEDGVLRWLCGVFGLPAGAGGLITTGGSMATLSAVVAARHARLGERFADGTLYVTAHTHHCVAKAARIAGFPASAVRTVPVTPGLRMDLARAAEMVADDRRRGLRPFLIVATAGSTDTGTVDSLAEAACLAASEDLWLHVDGAYGACFQLTERGRAILAGIGAADSIVLDPHKGLFLPYGTGVLLARDPAALRAAHSGDAPYLQDLDAGGELPDYATLGPELTREYRGLRLWLPLALHGVAAFRAALDEKLDLAAHAYTSLAGDPRLELPWAPDLSTVVFRLAAGGNEANRRFLGQINASRRVFLSSTTIGGRVMLRLCVLSHRTHHGRLREGLDLIHAAAAGRELAPRRP
jgi:glutamate/tyrosine decarboxylase-like PLP-dependent enzyme